MMKWNYQRNKSQFGENKVPNGYTISPVDFDIDNWKYQLVIHKGFNNEGIPEKRHDDFLKPLLNCNNKLKVFAINSNKIISK